jgi:hypothetical protein
MRIVFARLLGFIIRKMLPCHAIFAMVEDAPAALADGKGICWTAAIHEFPVPGIGKTLHNLCVAKRT